MHKLITKTEILNKIILKNYFYKQITNTQHENLTPLKQQLKNFGQLQKYTKSTTYISEQLIQFKTDLQICERQY